MTILAGCSLCAGMEILALVTAKAGGRGVIEFKGGGVALVANQAGVRPCQRKDRAVIKRGRFPAGAGVAVFTGSAFTPGMFIVFLVAANTVHRRGLEYAINVALGTLNRCMQTG